MEPSAGLTQALITRRFTMPGVDPLDGVDWVQRDAWPRAGTDADEATEAYFNPGVLVPADWRQTDLDVVSKLYLSKSDQVERKSVRRLIERVWAKITLEAIRHGYVDAPEEWESKDDIPFFPDFVMAKHLDEVGEGSEFWRYLREDNSAAALYAEGCYMQVHQMGAFNSPVWFNVGRKDRIQQVSACYILGIDDTTGSLMDAATRCAYVFKYGSGAGYNLGRIRGMHEELSTGGFASGPLSFRRMYDAVNGTFKSGGMTRRAAELVCLDDDHPDIEEFIAVKPREEERQRLLIKAGVNLSMDAEGERNLAECTAYQNANMSARITDRFMRKVVGEDTDPTWPLHARAKHSVADGAAGHGEVVKTVDAVELFDRICAAAWDCADPGVQYHDHFNRMHTTPSLDGECSPIRSTNPCFPGETLVDTSEGRIRIDRLAEMYAVGIPLPYAFGWDRESELPAMKRIRQAAMTKMVTELVEVTTDKGVVFRCTPEHKILTRVSGRGPSGGYVEAQHLEPGQRLRKIGHAANANRSRRGTINHRATESAPRGTVWRAPWMWEQAYGPVPEGMEVHHRNEDPTDDRLSNFELIDSGTHQSFHSAGERNGRYIDVDERALVEAWEMVEALYEDVTINHWNRYVRDSGLIGSIPTAKYAEKAIRGMSWQEFEIWVHARRGLVNDTVRSITRIRLADPVPVYDISVEDIHNFGVATEGVEHTIVVSNCGEYASNDDTSCNLASLNVVKFLKNIEHGAPVPLHFAVEDYRHAVDVFTLAMDVLVEFSEFPDDPERGGAGKFRHYTRRLRQLGLGYANVGAAIMIQGWAYDSDEGRDFAASVAALTTGRVYRKSAELARDMGPFHYWEENRESMLAVIDRHIDSIPLHMRDAQPIWSAAGSDWRSARALGLNHGYRNAQATVLAPTGTISFLMGCDTTGIEPAHTLVSHKVLAGGGTMTLVNGSVQRAAQTLGGYSEENLKQMADGDFSCIAEEDRAVFHGANEISPEGHIKMLGAVQPFISGGISKTVNLAESATVEDIRDAYIQAWGLGVKNVAVYRNNSKARQVLYSQPREEAHEEEEPTIELTSLDDQIAAAVPARNRVPRTAKSMRHKIHVRSALTDHEGYIHVGFFEDGRVGEFFVSGFGKSGSFVLNALGAWATAWSVAIQYGTPFDVLCRKHAFVADETGGVVVPGPQGEPLVLRTCESIIDYIIRWIVSCSQDVDLQEELGVMTPAVKERKVAALDAGGSEPVTLSLKAHGDSDGVVGSVASIDLASTNGHAREVVMGPSCEQCGKNMFRAGACWACSCGNTTGCG